MEFFHTVLLSLCFIKGCDLIVRSFCMSRAAIWNWYNASSDIGIIICATWQYSASASRRWRKYITVCAWKCFFFLSPSECSEYAVIWYRMPKITVMNYQYFFLFLKDFTSIVIHHLILLISSAVKCMQTVKALEYEQKALWAAVGVWKKKQTAFFRNAIIPPPSVFAVTGMFRFYRLSVIMMTLLVFLPLHWLCACICVSCSVFCFSSPSTTANELINITSLKRISYFNIYFLSKLLLNHASNSVLQYCAVQLTNIMLKQSVYLIFVDMEAILNVKRGALGHLWLCYDVIVMLSVVI